MTLFSIKFLSIVALLCLPISGFGQTGGIKKGIVYFSSDNGYSWENGSEGLPDRLFLTDIASDGRQLAVSTKQNGIYRYDVTTGTWNGLPTNPHPADDIDAILYFKGKLFAGTHRNGVSFSADGGKTWLPLNDGLDNLTIRRFEIVDGTVLAGTNGGLYALDQNADKWKLLYGDPSLQVNGVARFGSALYIGTNRGIYKGQDGNWQHIFTDHALHNIAVANNSIYALAYNEQFVSHDEGNTWENSQDGIPPGRYTFQVVEKDRNVLAAQWDGIYRLEKAKWIHSDSGLPPKFPVTEMKRHGNLIIAASSGWPD